MTDIKEDPYNFICDYAESLYPHVGRKTFEVLSLMPVSLIAPDLPFGDRHIRSNINALFLAPAGAGKTSIAKLFASFTFFPLEFESITAAGLEESISESPTFSIIVGDFARMSRSAELVKLIEGILGEEKSIKRKTARKDIDLEVNGVALLCGVASDLAHYIMSGMVWRVVPIMVGHNFDEHSDIGKHIKDKIGNSQEDNRREIIQNYYLGLLNIQSSDDKIVGYNISKKFRDEFYKEWEKKTEPLVKSLGLNFFRELQEGFRFLISSAFLNIYNREVSDGILTPNQEDFDIALKLMLRAITFKDRLIRSQSFAKGIKNAKEFKRIMDSSKIPQQTKDIIRNLVKIEGNKAMINKR